MKILKIKTTKGTYYTIVGVETKFNIYGKKEKALQKTLETNKNGRTFHPHISRRRDWKDWNEIHFSDLPKTLQKNFYEFESWLKAK
jgi:hypothetical protein